MRAPAAPANHNARMQSPLHHAVCAQNCEDARHLRTVRVLSANAFAVVVAAYLTALQLLRADRLIELTTLGFLVAVAAIQLLISLTPKRELDDCMARIEGQLASTRWHGAVGHHARAIVARNFFVAVTAIFVLYYGLVPIEHGSRRLVHPKSPNMRPRPGRCSNVRKPSATGRLIDTCSTITTASSPGAWTSRSRISE